MSDQSSSDSEKYNRQVGPGASAVYSDNPIAYALRQSNMLYEPIKVQGNTIVMVPSESLNSMGFGNLATTIAYLENTERAAKSSQTQSDKSSKFDSSKTNSS